MKEREDRKRKAAEINLEIGDKVYVKNMSKGNKLTSNFNPTTHTVTESNRSDVHVRNDETGQEYRRNIIHLKKVEGNWIIQNKEKDDLDQNIQES